MTWWKKLVNCHNPYQSFRDWFFARWKCPKCGTYWEGISFFNDLTLATIENKKLVELRLECLECDFKEVVWERKQ